MTVRPGIGAPWAVVPTVRFWTAMASLTTTQPPAPATHVASVRAAPGEPAVAPWCGGAVGSGALGGGARGGVRGRGTGHRHGRQLGGPVGRVGRRLRGRGRVGGCLLIRSRRARAGGDLLRLLAALLGLLRLRGERRGGVVLLLRDDVGHDLAGRRGGAGLRPAAGLAAGAGGAGARTALREVRAPRSPRPRRSGRRCPWPRCAQCPSSRCCRCSPASRSPSSSSRRPEQSGHRSSHSTRARSARAGSRADPGPGRRPAAAPPAPAPRRCRR